MKKVVAFDLDGVVISDTRLRLSKFWIVRFLANYILLFTPLGRYLYLKRKANKCVIRIIKNRLEKGEKIMLVSETLEYHRKLVEKWLQKNKIPEHFLFLRWPGINGVYLKQNLPWDLLVENDELVAKTLGKLPDLKIRKMGHFFIICRGRRN